MIQIYRVLRKAYSSTPFDGEGAYRFGGRWSSPGIRLSYASEHQSLAMLEYFVHVDSGTAPNDLVLAIATLPDNISKHHVSEDELPPTWRDSEAPPELARFGDDFAATAKSCVLVVPSAIVPREHNWLLNPAHPEFRKLSDVQLEPLLYDRRMFRHK